MFMLRCFSLPACPHRRGIGARAAPVAIIAATDLAHEGALADGAHARAAAAETGSESVAHANTHESSIAVTAVAAAARLAPPAAPAPLAAAAPAHLDLAHARANVTQSDQENTNHGRSVRRLATATRRPTAPACPQRAQWLQRQLQVLLLLHRSQAPLGHPLKLQLPPPLRCPRPLLRLPLLVLLRTRWFP